MYWPGIVRAWPAAAVARTTARSAASTRILRMTSSSARDERRPESSAIRAVFNPAHERASVQLEAEARQPLADEPVERLLVLFGGVRAERPRVPVPGLEERIARRVNEIEVVAVAFLRLVARSAVVGVERGLAVADELHGAGERAPRQPASRGGTAPARRPEPRPLALRLAPARRPAARLPCARARDAGRAPGGREPPRLQQPRPAARRRGDSARRSLPRRCRTMRPLRRLQRAEAHGARLHGADRGDRPGPRPGPRRGARPRGLARGAKDRRRRPALGSCADGGGGPVDLVAVRRGLPVLERYAYLNAGTFGPLPRATVEAMQEVEGRELRDGRASHAYFERVMAQREELRSRF